MIPRQGFWPIWAKYPYFEAPIWEALLEGSREPLGDLILREAGFGPTTAQEGLKRGSKMGSKYPYFRPLFLNTYLPGFTLIAV